MLRLESHEQLRTPEITTVNTSLDILRDKLPTVIDFDP